MAALLSNVVRGEAGGVSETAHAGMSNSTNDRSEADMRSGRDAEKARWMGDGTSAPPQCGLVSP